MDRVRLVLTWLGHTHWNRYWLVVHGLLLSNCLLSSQAVLPDGDFESFVGYFESCIQNHECFVERPTSVSKALEDYVKSSIGRTVWIL